MRTVVITRPGGPDVLEVVDRPVPTPAPGEVLVRVRAAGLNRADLLQRRGGYPAPPGVPPDVPGLEFAGEVAQAADGDGTWREGDRVFGIAAGGAQAEYLSIRSGLLAPIPEGMSWTDAAAVPEAFMTAFDALVTQAELRPEERLLVHAVGSGVGVAAVQLARVIGATAYGTSRTPDKLDRAREWGMTAGLVLPGGPEPLTGWAREVTHDRGMSVVLELVGGPYVPASLAALGEKGRLLLVGLVAGRSAEIDLGAILRKRLSVQGTVLRGRSLAEKIAVTRAFTTHVVPMLADGRVRPVVDTVFPIDDVRAAHERLEANTTFGKVVLAI
ncbi:MAG TPA: NAD(P)H-quinone oxidoreductase [Gemmatimonadaceae bacterium]|nr:NAD(P)H-quinone oxidoreductase [Gemmatimonadaceae bacterium]